MKRKLFFPIFLVNASTFLLILLWAYAGLSKLVVYSDFRAELMGHELIRSFAATIAWLVPSVELIVAFILLAQKDHRPGLYLSFAMLAIFTAYIVYMFIFYPHTPCSCGGVISALSWKEHIVFNLCFMLVALAGVAAGRAIKKYSIYR